MGKKDFMDIQAGAKLRLRRQLLGLSQKAVALRLGITFQQVQKYEQGAYRISAGRLQQLATLLNVRVAYCFDEPQDDPFLAKIPLEVTSKETIKLARDITSIGDDRIRSSLISLVKVITKAERQKSKSILRG